MPLPYQKYHLKWPWTPRQVENLDDMLSEVFKALSVVTTLVEAAAGTTSVTTETLNFLSGEQGEQGEQGLRGSTGPTGPQGPVGVGLPGQDGEDAGSWPLVNGPTVLPLPGTKVYYVSDTSGGAVTRKLTFVNGLLTSET